MFTIVILSGHCSSNLQKFCILPLNTDDRNGICCFGIEKACVVTRNYTPCTAAISTTLNLPSVRSVTNSMYHSCHSPFHGSRSSNFDFLVNVFNFFRNYKKGRFLFFDLEFL